MTLTEPQSAASAGPEPADGREEIVTIDQVTKVFRDIQRGEEIVAIRDLSLTIRDREFVAILGPSGCGKSTLLNILAGFEEPSSGRVLLNGVPVRGPGRDRGVVFQDYGLFPWLTVRKNIEFGLQNQGIPKAKRQLITRDFTRLVHLEGFEDRYPRELSGGMKQRVAIARVLANDPRILLMDEPFGALDALTRHAMQKQLLEVWQRHQKTVLLVTHSVDEALYLADRVIVLSARPGRILDIVTVDAPRPRDLTSVEFNRQRGRALELLEAEVDSGA